MAYVGQYQFKRLSFRSKASKICIVLYLIFAGLLAMTDLVGTVLIDTWNDPFAPVAHAWENTLIYTMLIFAVGVLVSFILSVVYVCMWMYRANANARALGAVGMSVSPGWSAGWWFIPIANLWLPYRAMKEIYLTSQGTHWRRDVKTSVNPPRLKWWWGLWLMGLIMSQLSENLGDTSDPALIEISVYVFAFEVMLDIVTAWLLFGIIDDVVRWQQSWAMRNADPDLRRCPECGYDLRASTGPTCPECGFDERMLADYEAALGGSAQRY